MALKSPQDTTTISEDIADLERIENNVLNMFQMASSITKEMSLQDVPSEERISSTKKLVIDYLQAVDDICDSLRKHADKMENYRESYRVDGVPWLEKAMDLLEATTVPPTKVINLEQPQKRPK